MKSILIALSLCIALAGCTTAPAPVTDRERVAANVVEDFLSTALVPVLAKNRDYLAAAKAISDSLGVLDGTSITPEGVAAFLAKTPLSPEDQKTVAGIVVSAWGTFQRRYAEQASASVRPDAKLFIGAVSRGIANAVASVPQ